MKVDRRKFMGTTLGGVAASLAARPDLRDMRHEAPRPPNILWICTDQQRYDTVHALGCEHIRTPNLDKLVERGVGFTHAHCQSPVCTPSRSSFLTGRYPRSVHGCRNGNDQWVGAAPLITKTMANAGYDCGLSGKLHLSAAHRRVEQRPDDGYRVFHWSHHPADSWPEGHDYMDWLRSKGINHTELKKKLGYIPTEYHQTTWCTDRAIDFMTEERDGPWLFSLNCFDPHPPLDPPKEFLDRFDVDSLPEPLWRPSDEEAQKKLEDVFFQRPYKAYRGREGRTVLAKYWAMIELIDHNVGRMIRTLEETGQRDNTLIIFTSDHGNMVGHHGLMDKGCRFYEGLVRVPLIFSLPGRIAEGTKSDALVELVDIAPTILDLCGLPPDGEMHGRSLAPLLAGGADPGRHRDWVYSDYTNALPWAEKGNAACATMIRTRTHKLVTYHGRGRGELFDLASDPGEFVNLWDDPSYQRIKTDLMVRGFDVNALTSDMGSEIVAGY